LLPVTFTGNRHNCYHGNVYVKRNCNYCIGGYNFNMADEVLSITRAARKTGISRITLRRWVIAGKLKAKAKMVNNRPTTLVSLAAVRKLVGDGVKPGRPKKKLTKATLPPARSLR
jgi:transposase-like protein